MRCPKCDGEGRVVVEQRGLKYGCKYAFGNLPTPFVPCPECLGARIIHCCDGLAEQPDAAH